MDLAAYRDVLTRIRDYLRIYGEDKWTARVDEWLRELADIRSLSALRTHVERSKRATGGMGSLGDLTICRQNGHIIENDVRKITEASQGLHALTAQLYHEAKLPSGGGLIRASSGFDRLSSEEWRQDHAVRGLQRSG
jgi:threonine aldolase